MKKRTAFISAILSLIPFGQPILIKTSAVLSTTGLMLYLPERVNANSAVLHAISAKNYFEERDFENALSDLNKAIQIYPQDYYLYYLRSYVKKQIKDFYGEISDLNKAIERYRFDYELFVNRGTAKYNLGDKSGGCNDWQEAFNLGYKEAAQWLKEEC
tara:strand:- start:201 stop:674 length:474 start_codon:yes stop_codon:yes gene_type:complete